MRMRLITPYYGVKGLRILTLPVSVYQRAAAAGVDPPRPLRWPELLARPPLAVERSPDEFGALALAEGPLRSLLASDCEENQMAYARREALAAGGELWRVDLGKDGQGFPLEAASLRLLLRHCSAHRRETIIDTIIDTIIEVPRPVAEAGTLELAMDLFTRVDARALVITGGPQLSAAVSPLLRRSRPPPATLVVRGFSPTRPIEEDILVSTGALPLGVPPGVAGAFAFFFSWISARTNRSARRISRPCTAARVDAGNTYKASIGISPVFT